MAILMSGCIMYETASYHEIKREPVDPPVAATPNPDTDKWYETIAQGTGDLISLSWIVGIVGKVKELGETIVYGIRDVKTQTYLTERKIIVRRIITNERPDIEVTRDGAKKTIK